jgi:hypothetical protein
MVKSTSPSMIGICFLRNVDLKDLKATSPHFADQSFNFLPKIGLISTRKYIDRMKNIRKETPFKTPGKVVFF